MYIYSPVPASTCTVHVILVFIVQCRFDVQVMFQQLQYVHVHVMTYMYSVQYIVNLHVQYQTLLHVHVCVLSKVYCSFRSDGVLLCNRLTALRVEDLLEQVNPLMPVGVKTTLHASCFSCISGQPETV